MMQSTPTAPSAGDWARQITPAAAGAAAGRPGRRTSLGIAAALIANPLAMTAWFLVEPAVLPREEPRVFLDSVAASPDRYLAATGLIMLAGTLAIPAALGFVRVLRGRLPRLAAVVGVLMFLSGVGLCAQVGFRAVMWSIVDPGAVPASAVESFAAFQDGGLFDVLVAPGIVFGGVATLLTVGALLVTGILPRWVPAAMIASAVLASGEFADPVTIAGAALGVVANVRVVRALLG